MLKVIFTKKAYEQIDIYTEKYRSYHRDLYKDSWIWNEEKIIDNYFEDSREKYFQIVDEIVKRLENPVISYTDNEAIIKWRTKILIVNFKDEWETRIITDISIR